MITKAPFYGVVCASVVIGIVIACLWPFHSPRNEVFWLKQGDGVRFGRYATILSRGAIMPSSRPAPSCWTLEIWLRPGEAYQSGTILAFYNAQQPHGFLLRQWNADLVLERELWNKELSDETSEVRVEDLFLRPGSVFLTITSDSQGTNLYVDGNLYRTARGLRLSADDLSGQLVVANSPVDNDSWSGELRGLALYSGELAESEILRYCATWTQAGRPDLSQGEGLVALYLFNDASGNVIHNQVLSGANLYVPERYLEVHQAFLKRPWDEYRPSSDYWKDVLINVVGFAPLGFFLYGYLSLALRVRHAALITVFIGGVLSFTVETLQAFLPTRDSGMTDIITNTLGAAAGVALCHYASIVCESLSYSRHVQVRRLAALLTRDAQEKLPTLAERVSTGL